MKLEGGPHAGAAFRFGGGRETRRARLVISRRLSYKPPRTRTYPWRTADRGPPRSREEKPNGRHLVTGELALAPDRAGPRLPGCPRTVGRRRPPRDVPAARVRR